MQKNVYAVAVLGLTMVVAPACATKKFVSTEVGSVNSKVDTLSDVGRNDAGADAPERDADRRGGRQGRSGRAFGRGGRSYRRGGRNGSERRSERGQQQWTAG